MSSRARVILVALMATFGLISPAIATPALAAPKEPSLDRISPSSGYYSGGTQVTLTGKHFESALGVTFGTEDATVVSRTTDKLVVRTPIGVPGEADVIVTSKNGKVRGKDKGITFTYMKPASQSSLKFSPAEGSYVAADVDWVTGGYDAETGQTNPWVVSLPKGAKAPTVGQQFLLRPGNPAFRSGLAGTVSTVADQLDQTLRVTVQSTDLEKAVNTLDLDYSGPVPGPAGGASIQSLEQGGASVQSLGRGKASRQAPKKGKPVRPTPKKGKAVRQAPKKGKAVRRSVELAGASVQSVEEGKAFEFGLVGPTPLFCKDERGGAVSFGADLMTSVTDVDVDQHLDLGGWVDKPRYDGAFTAELQTTGKITVAAAATCQLKPAWQNANRKTILLGTTGATLSFGPSFEFKVSAKGTWSIEDRTRTTFAVNAVLGSAPTYSRTSNTIESKQSGEGTLEVEVTAGISVQLGLLDRAGLQAKVQLGIAASLKASTAPNICVEAEVFAKMTVGVFLDVWVTRWEADAFSAKISIYKDSACLRSEGPAGSDEPEIMSARLPDATIASAYRSALTTSDGRQGTWSDIDFGLPAGLTLASSGSITGIPQGPVGDYPVLVEFVDASGKAATTTVWIRVQPTTSLGGGDIQVTLRWSGAADLDLHTVDPSGQHIYYGNSTSASGGQLDHDANAGCNGPADDDNPVENIYWPTGTAPNGSYQAWVSVWSTCGAPVDWHLTVRRNGALIVDQTGSGSSSAYSFDLGS